MPSGVSPCRYLPPVVTGSLTAVPSLALLRVVPPGGGGACARRDEPDAAAAWPRPSPSEQLERPRAQKGPESPARVTSSLTACQVQVAMLGSDPTPPEPRSAALLSLLKQAFPGMSRLRQGSHASSVNPARAVSCRPSAPGSSPEGRGEAARGLTAALCQSGRPRCCDKHAGGSHTAEVRRGACGAQSATRANGAGARGLQEGLRLPGLELGRCVQNGAGSDGASGILQQGLSQAPGSQMLEVGRSCLFLPRPPHV